MRIDLAPEEEEALEEVARKRGTTPESFVAALIRQHISPEGPLEPPAEPSEPANLAEFLAGYIGVLDSGEFVPGGANMSVARQERFSAILQSRKEQDRL